MQMDYETIGLSTPYTSRAYFIKNVLTLYDCGNPTIVAQHKHIALIGTLSLRVSIEHVH